MREMTLGSHTIIISIIALCQVITTIHTMGKREMEINKYK